VEADDAPTDPLFKEWMGKTDSADADAAAQFSQLLKQINSESK
jgi:hypothetical protein